MQREYIFAADFQDILLAMPAILAPSACELGLNPGTPFPVFIYMYTISILIGFLFDYVSFTHIHMQRDIHCHVCVLVQVGASTDGFSASTCQRTAWRLEALPLELCPAAAG